MSERLTELEKLLNPFTRVAQNIPTYFPKINTSSFSTSSYNTASSAGSSNIMFYFGIALTIIFVILIVIHYGFTPVFTFGEGGSGSLPLANTTDGQLVWTKGPVEADISANIIRVLPYGFTVQQDIFIQRETTLSNRSRVFSYRASAPVDINLDQVENLSTIYPESNLLMFLSPNTNDLIVQAVTQKSQQEEFLEAAPTILNVPIGEVFRLTVVFLPEIMEIYINGKLHSSKIFKYTPKPTTGNFYGPPEAFRQTIKVMNFKYWDRALSPGEVRNSTPVPPDRSLFNPDQTNGATCS